MIVASLLILVAAAGLLVTGLMRHNDLFLAGSIAASVIAAIGLYMGARSSGRDEDDDADGDGADDDDGREDDRRERYAHAGRRRDSDHGRHEEREAYLEPESSPQPPVREPEYPRRRRHEEDPADHRVAPVDPTESFGDLAPPAQSRSRISAEDDPDDGELADEPAPMSITRIDRTRLAGLTVPVQVVDGRPRYHLPGCVHLLGKDDEPLPVNEAVELGFTPCGLCEPTAAVLAELSVRSGRMGPA